MLFDLLLKAELLTDWVPLNKLFYVAIVQFGCCWIFVPKVLRDLSRKVEMIFVCHVDFAEVSANTSSYEVVEVTFLTKILK